MSENYAPPTSINHPNYQHRKFSLVDIRTPSLTDSITLMTSAYRALATSRIRGRWSVNMGQGLYSYILSSTLLYPAATLHRAIAIACVANCLPPASIPTTAVRMLPGLDSTVTELPLQSSHLDLPFLSCQHVSEVWPFKAVLLSVRCLKRPRTHVHYHTCSACNALDAPSSYL